MFFCATMIYNLKPKQNMALHIPKDFNEVVHSPVTLVTGTALITTAVLVAYNNIRNADGDILLDVATSNLVSLAQMMIA